MESKSMLFPEMAIGTTFEDARMRVQKLTGINDSELLNQEMLKHVKNLMEKGMIEINENMMVSRVPSAD